MNEKIVECNGFYIEYNVYGRGEYTVFYCGDDLWFDTFEEAEKFCLEQE